MLKRVSVFLVVLSLMSFLFAFGPPSVASAHSLSPTQFKTTLHHARTLCPSRGCTTLPTCTSVDCYQLDPYTQSNCGSFNDVTSVSVPLNDSNGNRIGTLYNWYSPDCNTNWASASLYYGYDGVRVEINTTAWTGSYEEQDYPTDKSYQYGYSPESVYSSMVDGTDTTYARGYTQYGPSNYIAR